MPAVTADSFFRFRDENDFFRGPESVSTRDSALLVMDVQRFFAPDGQWPIPGINETNKVIHALVERYRKVGPTSETFEPRRLRSSRRAQKRTRDQAHSCKGTDSP